jgi:hypothetical protein
MKSCLARKLLVKRVGIKVVYWPEEWKEESRRMDGCEKRGA